MSAAGSPPEEWQWVGEQIPDPKPHRGRIYFNAVSVHKADYSTTSFTVGNTILLNANSGTGGDHKWMAQIVNLYQETAAEYKRKKRARHIKESGPAVDKSTLALKHMRCTVRWFEHPQDLSFDIQRNPAIPAPEVDEYYVSDHVEDDGFHGCTEIRGRAWPVSSPQGRIAFFQDPDLNYNEDFDRVCVVRCFVKSAQEHKIRTLHEGELVRLLTNPTSLRTLYDAGKPHRGRKRRFEGIHQQPFTSRSPTPQQLAMRNMAGMSGTIVIDDTDDEDATMEHAAVETVQLPRAASENTAPPSCSVAVAGIKRNVLDIDIVIENGSRVDSFPPLKTLDDGADDESSTMSIRQADDQSIADSDAIIFKGTDGQEDLNDGDIKPMYAELTTDHKIEPVASSIGLERKEATGNQIVRSPQSPIGSIVPEDILLLGRQGRKCSSEGTSAGLDSPSAHVTNAKVADVENIKEETVIGVPVAVEVDVDTEPDTGKEIHEILKELEQAYQEMDKNKQELFYKGMNAALDLAVFKVRQYGLSGNMDPDDQRVRNIVQDVMQLCTGVSGVKNRYSG